MKRIFDFDEIRPFYDEELPEVIQSLLSQPEFLRVIAFAMPDADTEVLKQLLETVKSKLDFQKKLARPFLEQLAQKTADSLDMGGVELLDKRSSYTFITNHRDIVLDASFLNALFLQHGFNTSEVAIGDNLLIYPWIENLVRINKSFIVKRGVSVRKMLEISQRLSSYIHFAVKIKNQSVWIAQREGRSKDADDRTQESLLKMLNLGGYGSVLENMISLNIAPVAISYEYDPCDYLKASEFQLKRDNADYKKSPAADLLNMQTGMFGYKGHVHFEVSAPIADQLKALDSTMEKAQQLAEVARIIDRSIHLNYRIYAGNYVAYDLLNGTERCADKYSTEERATFEKYLASRMDKITDVPNKDENYLRTKMLEMYANPLKNQLIAKGELA